MSITLYHCRDARSLRPLWTLEELGVDYDLVKMEFPPRFTYDGYLDINPLGTVPTMIIGRDQNKVTLTESVAMVQYLADIFGPTDFALAPSHNDYPLYLNWLHRSDATLTFPQTLILRYAIFEKPERQQPQVVADYTQWFFSRLRSIEAALEDRDYLVADSFTIADICVGFALFFAVKLKLDGKFGPRTRAYYTRLTARDGFKRALEKQSDLKEYF